MALIVTPTVITDPMTNLSKIELGEVAERAVKAQQWEDLALPLVLVLAHREREAGQRPPSFYELFHVAQMRPGQRIVAGAFDAALSVLPEGSVPARAASIVPRDEE
jgi:hypothetical protein